MSTNPLSRRQFLKIAGASAGVAVIATTMSSVARADELPALTENDPTAAALGYKDDASKVDASKFPQHKPNQTCAACNFYQGTAARAPCTLFPGKSVNAKGWCSAFAAKV
ncbi:MAG: high-potential iron-sulfur protein [Tahibacter sp.]